MDSIEGLFTFISNSYQSFNVKEFFVAIFVDIRDDFDSVNIQSLMSKLYCISLSVTFYNIIFTLFSHMSLSFTSIFGSQ